MTINKYKFKVRKDHFFLPKNIAKIYIKRSYTNIFITLCDLNNKVIICKSSGSVLDTKNKRKKKIAQTVEKIILILKKTIKLYNINSIFLILKMKIKSHIYTLINKIKYYGVNILNISSKKSIAHNGVKSRNIRRL